ncbi:DUF3179 domain-containing protein [Haloechinothrix sp. LS1_15]|uniref:DUF3179 domain-containing protein n=1 Tax=Haloechinothrix sp. LS1_15 TaxID=2652248 RepID=UPI002946A4CB|nr:DUF3179 domain-containing protein [Haloechinothrix sp. LS1_15]MDV6013597.1 DUF3179 domain-containing protein [Haloechinothrix sp. LS1_15]
MEGSARSAPGRRQVLKGAGVLGGLAVLGGTGGLVWRARQDTAGSASASANGEFDDLVEATTSGGPGKDGIPSIDDPRFVTVDEVDYLDDDDVVFGLRYGGEVRAYPQPVLVWHEIVNDRVGGDRLVVTYCPLTGTTIGFTGTGDRDDMTFGTTGKLVNSNLLMYDRETDSEWPQVLGTAITGPLMGEVLRTVPLVWTTWRAWREAHPDSAVLSLDTGAARDYTRDPYGSYPNRSGYYVDEGTLFPVLHTDDRFGDKEVVLGVRAGGEQLAIPKELVRQDRSVEADVGGVAIRAEWDEGLATARVWELGNGLETADFMDAMWFAWFAFYPDTEVMR